jgi:hypothetical protein
MANWSTLSQRRELIEQFLQRVVIKLNELIEFHRRIVDELGLCQILSEIVDVECRLAALDGAR